ncbi:MAG: FliM/FliN family flagellar motor switch protein [bacterium]|nr:FliM/FliN family flagellar motor switch protein [bacterium]
MSLSQSEIDSMLTSADELVAEADASGGGAEGTRPERKPINLDRLPEDIRRILDMRVPVIVTLCERHMPVSEVVSLTCGSIIEFERSADADLELLVNNQRIGSGQAVKIGESFGLRVSGLGDVHDTVRAMGG